MRRLQPETGSHDASHHWHAYNRIALAGTVVFRVLVPGAILVTLPALLHCSAYAYASIPLIELGDERREMTNFPCPVSRLVAAGCGSGGTFSCQLAGVQPPRQRSEQDQEQQ